MNERKHPRLNYQPVLFKYNSFIINIGIGFQTSVPIQLEAQPETAAQPDGKNMSASYSIMFYVRINDASMLIQDNSVLQ